MEQIEEMDVEIGGSLVMETGADHQARDVSGARVIGPGQERRVVESMEKAVQGPRFRRGDDTSRDAWWMFHRVPTSGQVFEADPQRLVWRCGRDRRLGSWDRRDGPGGGAP